MAPEPGVSDLAAFAQSSRNTVYAYSFTGDIETPASAPSATTAQSTGSPFKNLSVSGVTVTLGAPTGTIAACATGGAPYTDTFGANAGRTFIGTVSIPKTGTLNFLGTESGGGAQVQFSVSDATGGPVQGAGANGAYTYSYSDARFFFGGNSTFFDGLYRCVNLTLVATP
jgi:hypothetical protein